MPKFDFENAMKRLENIVNQLDNGELSLDESLQIFQEGLELSQKCGDRLNQAENQLKTLIKKENGGFQLELADFEN
ncbi:exodeoxyribonuclease VII small subunit [candidate division KSB1 bacterium]|nr:exodeoxyribonuclease VII small subunit [candidate division KSB1 bacterium]